MNASTGPRTSEGKAVSRMNALKTGIYAKEEVVLATEKVEDLQRLTAEYYDQFAPTTPEQRALVDALINDEWLLRRFRTIEAQVLTNLIRLSGAGELESPLGRVIPNCDQILERLQRRVNATRRNFRQSLELLRKLQAETTKPLPFQSVTTIDQFVPSVPPASPAPLALGEHGPRLPAPAIPIPDAKLTDSKPQ